MIDATLDHITMYKIYEDSMLYGKVMVIDLSQNPYTTTE
jgi:hypothetical protein